MLTKFKKKRDKSEINAMYQEQWSNLSNTIISTAKRGNVEDALIMSSDLHEFSKEKFGRYSRQVVLSLNNMAEICIAAGKYKEAESYLNNALKICEKALGQYVKESSIVIDNLSRLYTTTGITIITGDNKEQPVYRI